MKPAPPVTRKEKLESGFEWKGVSYKIGDLFTIYSLLKSGKNVCTNDARIWKISNSGMKFYCTISF